MIFYVRLNRETAHMTSPQEPTVNTVHGPERQVAISRRRSVVSPFVLVLTLFGLVFLSFFFTDHAMATEEPTFHLSLQEGNFQVRDYPTLIAAEVSVKGDRREAATAGFKLLAGYIFGANQRREKVAMTAPVVQSETKGETIAMTAPVIQTQASTMESEPTWTIRFVMPSRYALNDLPVPNDTRVVLKVLPPQRFAVHRFSGLAHEADVVEKTSALMAFAAKRQLHPAGLPSLARYNPPWTPWFMRRNEILLPIEP
jgi:SOUL heme-binding protein